MMRFRRGWIGLLVALALAAAGCSRIAPGSWPGVTVGEDTVWVAYQQQVYAVAKETGAPRWAFPLQPERDQTFFAAPQRTPDGQTLVVGGYDHVLYGLDPATGAEQWRFTDARDRYIGAALVTEQGIFAPNGDGTLYALTRQGTLRWTFTAQAALWAPPATDGQTLYLASLDHHLYALDLATGQEKWRVNLEGALPATPTLLDGVLYVGELATQVAAVRAEDGTVLWETPVAAWVWHSPTPLGEEHLVVGDMEGHVYALRRSDGGIVWQTQVEGGVIGAPAVHDETVFVTTRAGLLIALDATNGAVRWQRQVHEDAGLEAGPIVVPDWGLLLAPSDAANPLRAVDFEGQPLWSFEPQKK